MKNQEILSRVDHTLLRVDASWNDIKKLCEEAVVYKTASVCIPPSYVKRVRDAFPGLCICTVIGFPLGYSLTDVKLSETTKACADGADELDAVINLGDVKNREFDKIIKEITVLKSAAKEKTLKIIIETCYLTKDEKIELCKAVTEGGADYIKTSTGFGSSGAILEDVLLFKEHIGPDVKIKAAGGIRSRQEMEMYLSAGCSRLGTSSAIVLLAES